MLNSIRSSEKICISQQNKTKSVFAGWQYGNRSNWCHSTQFKGSLSLSCHSEIPIKRLFFIYLYICRLFRCCSPECCRFARSSWTRFFNKVRKKTTNSLTRRCFSQRRRFFNRMHRSLNLKSLFNIIFIIPKSSQYNWAKQLRVSHVRVTLLFMRMITARKGYR